MLRAGILQGRQPPGMLRAGILQDRQPPGMLRAAPSCAGSHSSVPAEHHKRLTSVASAGRPRSCYTRRTATEKHRRPLRKQPGEAAALHTNTKGKSIQRFAFRRIYTLHLSQNLALTAKNSAPHRARNTNNAQTPQKPSANAKYSASRYARGTNNARIRQDHTANSKYSAPYYARSARTARIRQGFTASAKHSASHYTRSTVTAQPPQKPSVNAKSEAKYPFRGLVFGYVKDSPYLRNR